MYHRMRTIWKIKAIFPQIRVCFYEFIGIVLGSRLSKKCPVRTHLSKEFPVRTRLVKKMAGQGWAVLGTGGSQAPGRSRWSRKWQSGLGSALVKKWQSGLGSAWSRKWPVRAHSPKELVRVAVRAGQESLLRVAVRAGQCLPVWVTVRAGYIVHMQYHSS